MFLYVKFRILWCDNAVLADLFSDLARKILCFGSVATNDARKFPNVILKTALSR